MFGPPIAYWTGRFESKHRIAKMTAESAKNVINITKTITERQQMRAVSVFYHGMFSSVPFHLPHFVLKKSEMADDSDVHITLKAFMNDDDLICKTISIKSQSYTNGDLIIIDLEDCDNIDVGLIETILVRENRVYFVVKRYKAVRNRLQYFESQKQSERPCEFIEFNRIVDFKPLIKRGTSEKFVFVFHHYISFDYK